MIPIGGERFGGQCPRSWACAEDRSDPIRQWVSEDRRSRAARWGAWATKVRWQFGINHLDLAAEHRLHHRLVARAAADVAGQLLSKLFSRPAQAVPQQGGCGDHEPWSAEAALDRTLSYQLALEWGRCPLWP